MPDSKVYFSGNTKFIGRMEFMSRETTDISKIDKNFAAQKADENGKIGRAHV